MGVNNFKQKLSNFKLKLKENIFSINYWLYVLTGVWELTFEENWKNKLFKVNKVVVITGYVTASTLYAIDVYTVAHDIDELSFTLSNSVMVFSTLIKFVISYKDTDAFESILRNLDNHLYIGNVGDLKRNLKIFEETKIRMFYVSQIFYLLVAFILPVKAYSDTSLEKRIYVIPLPRSDLYEEYYEILYFLEFVPTVHFFVALISHEMVIYGILIRFISHFEALGKNFEDVKSLYPDITEGGQVQTYCDWQYPYYLADNIYSNRINNRLLKSGIRGGLDLNCPKMKKLREERTFELLKDNITHHQKILQYVYKITLSSEPS